MSMSGIFFFYFRCFHDDTTSSLRFYNDPATIKPRSHHAFTTISMILLRSSRQIKIEKYVAYSFFSFVSLFFPSFLYARLRDVLWYTFVCLSVHFYQFAWNFGKSIDVCFLLIFINFGFYVSELLDFIHKKRVIFPVFRL